MDLKAEAAYLAAKQKFQDQRNELMDKTIGAYLIANVDPRLSKAARFRILYGGTAYSDNFINEGYGPVIIDKARMAGLSTLPTLDYYKQQMDYAAMELRVASILAETMATTAPPLRPPFAKLSIVAEACRQLGSS